jgi:hypothetical protein
MELEASFQGTLRTILVLLIIWWVLRILLRKGRAGTGRGPARWTNDPVRPKGDVRIERTEERTDRPPNKDGSITDADFEELK